MTFARNTGQDIDYRQDRSPARRLRRRVEAFRAGGGRGVNVTAPFKIEALSLASKRMPKADYAGATNCLKFEDNDIIAENFDGVGLVRDIQHNLGVASAANACCCSAPVVRLAALSCPSWKPIPPG